ncbi:MAG: TA system VapC family ribonuclease toxin [Spirochaetota bacterium]
MNLLVYAHNTGVPEHAGARRWWEETVNGAEPVGIDWAVVLGFVRLMSSRRVTARPQRPDDLLARMSAILARPSVRLVTPGVRHADLMRELFASSGAGPRMVTDIHLAALAIEFDAVLATNDTDFARFPRLRRTNPLES